MRDPFSNRMLGATLLAGAISGITFTIVPGAVWVGPGLLFGVATAVVFKSVRLLDSIQALIWVVASTGAWYLAIRSYVAHVSAAGTGGYGSDIANMMVAGLIGSAILAVALSLLFRKVSAVGVAITMSCGVILAAVMYGILNVSSGRSLYGPGLLLPYIKFAAAFAIWQVGAGLSLLTYKRPENRWNKNAKNLSPIVVQVNLPPVHLEHLNPLPFLERHRKQVLVLAAGVVLVGLAGAAGLQIVHSRQDSELISNFGVVSQKVYQSIADTKIHSSQAVYSWRTATQQMASSYKLSFAPGSEGFSLCGTFLTDQSRGAAIKGNYKGDYQATDLRHHRSGYGCFNYSVSEAQALKFDSRIDKDRLVLNIRQTPSGEKQASIIDTYPLDPGARAEEYGITDVEIYKPSGSAGGPIDIKVGNTVSVYFASNLLTGLAKEYKVVIQDAGVNPHFCDIALLSGTYGIAPTPSCPQTLTNLTVKSISLSGLTANTTGKAEVDLRWALNDMPTVYGLSGNKTNLSTIVAGDHISLVLSGDNVSEIHIRP